MRLSALLLKGQHHQIPSSIKNNPTKVISLFLLTIATGSYTMDPYIPYSLNYAIQRGKINHVRRILKDPDTNLLQKDSDGNTPLHNAILAIQKAKNEQQRNTQIKIAQTILERVDCLNMCNNLDQTAGVIASEMPITMPIADEIAYKQRLVFFGMPRSS